ncbi:MAG TPA: tetratricopeptide repeat protein, partial [Deltaproteobacteria bacterium]|nr:tetratricopeptide repeat protein [Deltaproteobacteria bacterium]
MCLQPFYLLTLSSLGVYNCACPDWIKMKIGELGTASIAECWNSDAAQWIRRKMYAGDWEATCNCFCPHVINYRQTGKLFRYDELAQIEALTPQLIEEIQAGKTRLEATPTAFKLDNSAICNLDCIMCSRASYPENPDLVGKTMADLGQYLPSAKRIIMSGFGDPLARLDTRALLMDEGHGHLKFDLITNALLLPRFWERIRHRKFGDLLVSIDAADKRTYETIRRGGVWDDLLKSLTLLEENRDRFESITLNMTVMRENYQSIPAFIDFALSRGFRASFQRIRGPYVPQNIFEPPDTEALGTLRGILDHARAAADHSRVFFGDLPGGDAEQDPPAAALRPSVTPSALHQSAIELLQQGRIAEALTTMERVLAGDPQNAEAHNDLGAIYHAAGDTAKAQHHFEQALTIDPGDAAALKNMIDLCLDTNQLERARTMCDRLMARHPDDEEAPHLWALIQDRLSDTANSIQRNREQWSHYDWSEGSDEWSACWGGTEQLWQRTLLPRIGAFLPAGHILEIAPGFGRCTQYLVPQSRTLSIVDLTERCIEACRKRFKDYTHIRYFVNDGQSLDMIADNSIDFVFSWDSLVHVEKDVMRAYLRQLAVKLKPGAYGFLHHSNIGSFLDAASGKLTVENRHWRGESMSAALFRAYCEEAGLECLRQEILAWGGDVLNDCLSTFRRPAGGPRPKTDIEENPGFMEEARGTRRPPALYDQPLPDQ